MARLIKLEGLLHFRDSKSETQAEQKESDRDLTRDVSPEQEREVSPFKRVKQASGDFFLAAGVIPEPQHIN